MAKPTFVNRLDLVASIIDVGAMHAVNNTATEIAEAGADNAPKDRGVLSVSHYPLLEGEDHEAAFALVQIAAAARNPGVQLEQEVTIDDLSDEGIHQAAVEVAAPYGAAVHNGYSSVAGRPWLEETANSKESVFADNMRRIPERLDHI